MSDGFHIRTARADRKVLVFSDLTDSRAKTKKRLRDIGKLAAELADVAVFVGEHAHHGVRGAVAAGMDAARCHDVIALPRAAELLSRELRPGDLVFVKGRTTDHLSRLVFERAHVRVSARGLVAVVLALGGRRDRHQAGGHGAGALLAAHLRRRAARRH